VSGLFERLDDAVNPIAVRELRQAVTGRVLPAALLFFLVLQLGALGLYLVSNETRVSTLDTMNFRAGRESFLLLLGILYFHVLFFLPLYTAVRLSLDRGESNLDLLFVTTLTPRSIVWGKLLTGMILALLFYSAALPFMAFTYFLRGVDLPSIGVVLAFGLLACTSGLAASVLFGSVPGSRVFKSLLGAVYAGATFTFFVTSIASSVSLLGSGIGSRLGSVDFWGPAASVAGVALVVNVLFFTLSVATLTPPTANRAPPVRIALLVLHLTGFGVALTWSLRLARPQPLSAWLGASVFVLSLALFAGVSERETPGPRLRRAIPRSLPRRAVAFLFFSGRPNGVAFALVLLASTFLLASAALPFLGTSGAALQERIVTGRGFALYAFSYAVTAAFVRARLLPRLRPVHTWAVGMVLIVAGSLLPPLVGFLVFGRPLGQSDELAPWLVLNPFAIFDSLRRPLYLTVAASWSAICAVGGLRWFLRASARFRPDAEGPAA